jgi:hypothetical protein
MFKNIFFYRTVSHTGDWGFGRLGSGGYGALNGIHGV